MDEYSKYSNTELFEWAYALSYPKWVTENKDATQIRRTISDLSYMLLESKDTANKMKHEITMYKILLVILTIVVSVLCGLFAMN